MKLLFTKHLVRCYRQLPQRIRKAADKQFGLLLSNKHPSFEVKKMQDPREILEARVKGGVTNLPVACRED